jgi:hypothetical protein
MGTFAGCRRRWPAIAAVAIAMTAAAWTGSTGPASAHGACRYTGDRVTGLTASARVGCATAQRVAGAYDSTVMDGGSFPGGRVAVAGYSCRTTTVGDAAEETSTVRCSRGRNAVRFVWGV